MNNRTCLAWPFLLLASIATASAVELKSPDNNVVLTFNVQESPTYSVQWKGRPIIVESRLGLDVEGAPLRGGLRILRQSTGSHDETWKPVYGERNSYRDNYRQLIVELQETNPPQRLLTLTFRAYNEGVAFCYTLPKQPAMERLVLAKELTEFCFAADHAAWAVYNAQGNYAKVTLSQIKPGCERPLPIQITDDCYAAIGEAKLVDYARMKLAPLKGTPNALISDLSGKVESALPMTTPWRFVLLGDSPGQLLERNYLLLNLNDPCVLSDTSWIKPGKVIREVTLTTTGGKSCVDFAAKRGLQYIMFDAGWYGHEYDPKADATKVNLDPKRSKGPLDLQEVLRYAKERGIGVILYVNHIALEQQLDEVLPLYQKWGVKGIKFGFVNVGSQQWTKWLHDSVRKCADYKLLVDVHDEYRPTGLARTWPHWLTQEGIAGDETSPVNSNTLTILFSRSLAGAADNTICYYAPRVAEKATHAYQLAKAVCLYSPWQFLYWYDRPANSPQKVGGAGKAETSIGDEPELEFFDAVPTVWDDTKVLQGRIGEFAVIARRSGASWFIGAMNSGEPRTFDVPLKFLDRGRKYTAHTYTDDPSVPTRTHVKIERRSVEAGATLKLPASAQGGAAARIVPE